MKTTSAARITQGTMEPRAATIRRPAGSLRRVAVSRVRVPEPEQKETSSLYRMVFPCGIDTRSEKS